VPSELQLPDLFTKAHTHAHYQFYLSKLSVVYSLRGIIYVLTFSIIIFLQGVLCMFSPSYTCIYLGLWPSDEYKCYS
jgi:hypothetical protein